MSTTDVDRLNGFLRSEVLALQVYEHAISELEDEPSLEKLLRYCLESHQEREQWLRAQILALGGQPIDHLGSRATAKKLVERGASLLGTKVTLLAIEEGEARALEEYESEVLKFADGLRAVVEARLLPAQRDTHAKLTQIISRL